MAGHPPDTPSNSTGIPSKFRMQPTSLDSAAIDTLKKWLTRHWKPNTGIVQQITIPSPELELMSSEALRLCRLNGVPAGRVRTYLNQQLPDLSDGDFPDIYPHRHAIPGGTTVVIYLDAGSVPAALEILTDDLEVEELITPVAGQAVLIPNGVWHRVYKNRGTTPRMALIIEVYK